MSETKPLLIGGNGNKTVLMNASMANRHGLVAGATGTGKTVTLQILAENFSSIGVPVFLADIKGDVSGLGKPATPHPKIDERVNIIGINDYQLAASPVVFWDLFSILTMLQIILFTVTIRSLVGLRLTSIIFQMARLRRMRLTVFPVSLIKMGS